MNGSIMEDYSPNKQSVHESPYAQSNDESQPEQLVGDLVSVGEASKYELRHQHQHLMATSACVDYKKAATERKCKSRSEKNTCC